MEPTINLLSPSIQKKNRLINVGNQVAGFGVWIVFSLMILCVALLAGLFFFRSDLDSSREIFAIKQQELQDLQRELLKENVETLNQSLVNFQLLKENDLHLAGALAEFARILPEDMTLDKLVIDPKTGKVEVSGRSATRDSVLSLREHLLDSEYFQRVNFPLTNLEADSDTDWSYRFYLNQTKLKDR